MIYVVAIKHIKTNTYSYLNEELKCLVAAPFATKYKDAEEAYIGADCIKNIFLGYRKWGQGRYESKPILLTTNYESPIFEKKIDAEKFKPEPFIYE